MKTHRCLAAVLMLVGASALAQTQPAASIRPEVAPALQAAQKAINEKNFEEAMRQVNSAAAVPGLTPYESYVAQRFRALAADSLRDMKLALDSYAAVLDSPFLEAELRGPFADRASNAAHALKDYDAAVRWGRRALEGGVNTTVARLRLAQALYFQNQHPAAAEVLTELAARQRAASEKPAESQLRLVASNAARMNDDAAYVRALDDLLALYPKPEVWADRISRLMRMSGFDDRLTLDALRLGHQVRAWTSPEPWMALAENAQRAGFVAEARQVLEAGFERGVLGQGAKAAEHKALRERIQKQFQADVAPDPKAAAGRDAAYQFNTGWDLASRGQATEGIALMQQGVQRGLPRQADDARLRLAGALVAAGRAEEARPLFAALRDGGAKDGLADLARLWLIQIGQS
jgi:hypothetical protein